MKKLLLLFSISIVFYGTAQEITLKKGAVIDAIPVNDSIAESFSLFLPSTFDTSKKWPVIFVYNMEGKARQAVGIMREAAEKQGYILAGSNNVHDSISLSKNILISSRVFNAVYSLLPIQKDRSYTAGFDSGARLASLVPTFVKEIKGVISCGSPVANEAVLSKQNAFHFIGIVGDEDYNYMPMISSQKVLNKLRFPNQLLFFEGGNVWPETKHLERAMEILKIASMAKNTIPKEDDFIQKTYQKSLADVSNLVRNQKPLLANQLLSTMVTVYPTFKNIDSLRENGKTLRKTKLYRNHNRNQNTAFFKENLIKEDYGYYLEEDVLTYNYNNLGWWKYQMDELAKYEKSTNIFELKMGRRLKAYLNALIADNVDLVKNSIPVDEEALLFLWMVNTITDVKNFDSYLKIISLSARVEDYGTALFYVEELLRNGYQNKQELYALEHTALLRITPEFNKLIEKYLKDPRYKTIEE